MPNLALDLQNLMKANTSHQANAKSHPLSKSPCLACLRCVLQEGVLFPPVHQGLFTRGAQTCRNESTDPTL